MIGDLSIKVRSQLRYRPKLERALKRSYFQAISVNICLTRLEESSAGASCPVAVSIESIRILSRFGTFLYETDSKCIYLSVLILLNTAMRCESL